MIFKLRPERDLSVYSAYRFIVYSVSLESGQIESITARIKSG